MSNAARTILFTAFVPGTVAGLVPCILIARSNALFSLPLGLAHYLAWPIIAIGVAIYGACAWNFTFDGEGTPSPTHPPRNLVARGLYRWSRNPMYIGVVLVLAGEAIAFQSGNQVLYASFIFLAFHLRVILYEEPVLRKAFGDAYVTYCAKVPRWLPIGRTGGNRE